MEDDEYAESGEYLDIMSRGMWEPLGPAIAEVLRNGPRPTAPVLDIGAGSGLGTTVVARALPDVDIVAIEPNAALRAVLMSTVADNADLARRVTVMDTEVQRAELPDVVGSTVMINMIGHLGPADRTQLWASLAQRLVPDGQIVLTLQPPDHAVTIPESRFCEVTVGRRTYEGWGEAEPAGPDSVRWRMRYLTLQAGTVVRERTVNYHWWVVSEQRLRDEVQAHGLSVRAVADPALGLYTIAR